jgi:hypothetical protein
MKRGIDTVPWSNQIIRSTLFTDRVELFCMLVRIEFLEQG